MEENNSKTPVIFVVSDSLGETADLVARAAVSQFTEGHLAIRRIPFVTDIADIDFIFREADRYNSIITYTVVIPSLREAIEELAGEKGIPCIDLLGPTLQAISRTTGMVPSLETGLMRKLDEEYYRRVEAVEFAVKYDDGKDARGLKKADIVLVGVSRTSKTPVSMYLAHQKIRAANMPLVPEVPPPEELFEISPKKIVGLTIRAGLLNEIRQERLKALGLTSGAEYANPNRIIMELEYSDKLFKRLGCPVIDVTNRAVEETAGLVMAMI